MKSWIDVFRIKGNPQPDDSITDTTNPISTGSQLKNEKQDGVMERVPRRSRSRRFLSNELASNTTPKGNTPDIYPGFLATINRNPTTWGVGVAGVNRKLSETLQVNPGVKRGVHRP
ncbi:hypothetical protein GEV33_003078 [Tenebrio molitor]|uniref:Uncharacterized protein n=1 Tax=Tenebrio molitor TaxID=7067 RepID=A0A8J6LI30_TENMO|nr:hypothetical protein GEV33_003078 [Tenebrio molitor]